MKDWISAGIGIGALLGFALSRIPWGDPDGFHGVGWPFPVSVWDEGKDYVNPLVVGLNIVVSAASCGMIAVIVRQLFVYGSARFSRRNSR